jgi:ABC-type bacteriocin/lantibiotic exporter with double-glycine peptidase domain
VGAAAVVVLTMIGGCHTPLLRTTAESELAASERYRLIDSIDLPATHGHEGCAAAALAAILAYHEPALDPVALAAELPWHDEGASPVDLLLEARRRGFAARVERGAWERLAALAAAGAPALVMIDAGPEMQTLTRSVPLVPAMHWAVFSGVARDGSAALLAARNARHHVVIVGEFMRRWSAADYCLIVVERGQAVGDASRTGAAATLAAVRQWQFQPAQRGGEPVEWWVHIPIEFKLEPEPSQE